MFKNVSGQSMVLQAIDATTGQPKTGDASHITFHVNKDWAGANATSNAVSEIDATKAPGRYKVLLTQSETNADALDFSGFSSTPNINIIGQLVFTTPPNFTLFNLDSNGFVVPQVAFRPGIRKNVALPNFGIFMTDSTNHAPATGKTVALTRKIDAGVFATGGLSATPTEDGNGWYSFDWPQADLNGDLIRLRATASGCDDVNLLFRTTP